MSRETSKATERSIASRLGGQRVPVSGRARGEKRFLTGDSSAPAVKDIAETFPKIAALVVQFTRCGKPNCRCTAGHLHGPYHYLRWREGTIQRRRYVRAADVPAVRAILETRREQRRTERLALSLSMRDWRELGEWVAAYEARLREQEEQA